MGMRTRRLAHRDSGQMTIEMAVAMPALIAIAVIAVNVMTFFSECAVFDRVACDAVRVHATAPSYRQNPAQSCSLVEQAVKSQLDDPNLEVHVEHSVTGADFNLFTATLEFHPTLFGRGLRSEVFGVAMPHLTHRATYVVDSYKPGVVL